MRDECVANQHQNEWVVFQKRILGPIKNGRPAPSHQKLAQDLQLSDSKQSENLLTTAKRRFKRCLFTICEEYSHDPESEIKQLVNLVTRGIPLHLDIEAAQLSEIDTLLLTIRIAFQSNH